MKKLKQRIITLLKSVNPYEFSKKLYAKNYYLEYLLDFKKHAYLVFYNSLSVIDNVILYESFHGKSMGCNPFALFKALLDDPEFENYQHVWVVNNKSFIAPEFQRKNVTFVRVSSVKYKYYLARAKYLINNTTFPPYFIRKEQQLYLNTWHGTPLKTLGKDIKGTVNEYANVQRNLLQTTHLLKGNDFTADKLLNSNGLGNIYPGRLVNIGNPRTDFIVNHEIEQSVRAKLALSDKKVMLFAPTWRGDHQLDSMKEYMGIVGRISKKFCSEYEIFISVHTLMYPYLAKLKSPVKIKPNNIETNEFLSCVDVLITDYSSIMFDFAIKQKPILLYCPDLKSYRKERGLYFDIEKLSSEILPNHHKLIEAVADCQQNKHRYFNFDYVEQQFGYLDKGNSTAKLIDCFFNNNQQNVEFLSNKKTKILMYGGGLINNGITSSFINLLNAIDYDKYEICTIEGMNRSVDVTNQRYKINDNVHFFFRADVPIRTPNEMSLLKKYYKKTALKANEMSAIDQQFSRENRRVFGALQFDVVIDFSGYVRFWSSLLAFNPAPKKMIYQHNDMKAEYHKVIDGKYKHQDSLHVVFRIYPYFDSVVSVSKLTMELNIKSLQKQVGYLSHFKYATNIINGKEVIEKSKLIESFKQNGLTRLVLNHEQTEFDSDIMHTMPMPDSSKVNLFTAGRFSPEKRHDKLLSALQKTIQHRQDIHLYIAGSGLLLKKIQKLIKKLNLETYVTLTGQLKNPFVLLNLCDCFVLSSDHEGQPMVLLESLVLDKDIISTDVVGSRSVIANHGGVLVANNADALSEAFVSYEKNSQKHDFDFAQYNQQSLEMFYQLLDKDE